VAFSTSNRARARFRAAVLIAIVYAMLPGVLDVAEAQAKNGYGAHGRTVVSGAIGGFKSNIDVPDVVGHDASWSTWASFTAVHFWLENLAVGGTLLGGTSQLDGSLYDTSSRDRLGGDLDIIGHLPLTRRLSLSLWVWGGLRWSQRSLPPPNIEDLPIAVGGPDLVELQARRVRTTTLMAGVNPELLLHLSPSVALAFGPGVYYYKGLTGRKVSDYELQFGPAMTYSFGPDKDTASTFEDARRFGSRGRTVLQMYAAINRNDAYSDVGFSRFVIDRFALGAYAGGGFQGLTSAQVSFRAGLQSLIDLPVAPSLSVLLAPRVGYEWIDVAQRNPNPNAYDDRPLPAATVHQLKLAAPAYLALHLHDGLVLGVGPQVSCDRRLATKSSTSIPNETYLQLGVASTIAGSF